MNELMKIPKRINVGFQERSDTYTKKLAYVIYYDEKGKLRKETSWENWRDKNIPNVEFDNEPMSGFVLNQGVGGARQSWGPNVRNEYIRVYDPRDFEFEISVANLLFLLQECSAIKGKGLEGDFVYAWSGKELVLLPAESHEYKTSMDYTNLQTKKVTAKQMVKGYTYKTKDTKEVIYLGRHMWYENKWPQRNSEDQFNHRSGKKKHIFIDLKKVGKKPSDISTYTYIIEVGFTKLGSIIDETPHPEFSNEYEKLVKSHHTSKPKELKLVPKKLKLDRSESGGYCSNSRYGALEENGKLYSVCIYRSSNNRHYNHATSKYVYSGPDTYNINYDNLYELTEDGFRYGQYINNKRTPSRYHNNYYTNNTIKENATIEEVSSLVSNTIICVCENGAEYEVIEN